MPSKLVKGALSALRKEPEEKKMLQGFYRGFAGTPEKGETVYHAGAKFHDAPRPGTFTTPDKEAALKFGKTTGAKALHEFKATPRRSGSDADVIRAAKMHGVYEPGVPVGQYLEQGENAVFDASGEIVQTLRDFGYDSLRLHDAMSEAPSLVVLDPSIVKRPADTFVTPQKRVADYYAQKRAGQTGQEPHAEMVLADPFAGRAYGHSTPGTGATEPMTTKARKLRDSDIVDRTPLYAQGGSVATFKDGGAAFGMFPQMKPRRAENSGAGDRMTEEALKFLIPQDTTDLALMAFPFGKAGKAAAAGLMALTPSDAEAGKLKTGVDLARRSFFGLRPSQDMAGRELAPVQRELDKMQADLNKAEKVAPKVEERSVSIDPGKGSAKITDTVQKVASTPVSRRTMLKSATGQVLQNALPMQSFADLMKPVEVVKQAAQAAAPVAASTASMVPGLIAQAIKKGMDMDEAMNYVKSQLGKHGDDVFHEPTSGVVYDTLKNPFESIVDDPDWLYVLNKSGERERMKGPGELLQSQLSTGTAPGPLKEILRGVKPEMSPGDYANMKNAVRDAIYYADKYGFED
jgi:hypothetical protein